MRVGSLFTGIGGIDLGLEWAGMTTAWQVEIDPFCNAVLEEHWPDVKRFTDVRLVHGWGACLQPVANSGGAGRQQVGGRASGDEAPDEGRSTKEDYLIERDGQSGRAGPCAGCLDPVDLICGGFPCQDISQAGRGVGISGSRSGLWGEFARIIGELRPRYVLVENVPTLKARGLEVVLADLAALGYDAEWDCIPALAVGAPHRRDRLYLVAYPDSEPPTQRGERSPLEKGRPFSKDQRGGRDDLAERKEPVRSAGQGEGLGDTELAGLEGHAGDGDRPAGWSESSGSTGETGLRGRTRDMADANGDAWNEWRPSDGSEEPGRWDADRGRVREDHLADTEVVPERPGLRAGQPTEVGRRRPSNVGRASDAWDVEPDVGRVAHGVPNRVDRLTALGNAVVPQVAEAIGLRIMKADDRGSAVQGESA